MRSDSVTNAFRPLGLWEPAAAFGGTCIKQHVGRKTLVTELALSCSFRRFGKRKS